MNDHQVSRRVLVPCSCCSRFGLDSGLSPTPALVLKRSGLFLDPSLRSRPDPGLGLCRPPRPAQALRPDPTSRPGPVQYACPCLVSMSGLDWSVPLGLCQQSSRPAPAVGLARGPRCRRLGPCWSSSSGPETATAPCWTRGPEATHPSPLASGAAWQRAEPWSPGPPHWPDYLMTSLSSWWLGNLLFLWKHSEGPHT